MDFITHLFLSNSHNEVGTGLPPPHYKLYIRSDLPPTVWSMHHAWFHSPYMKYAQLLISLPLYEVYTRSDFLVQSMHQVWSPCTKYAPDLISLYKVCTRSDLPVQSMHQVWSPCTKYAPGLISLYKVCTRSDLPVQSMHQVWSPCMKYTPGMIPSPIWTMKYTPGLDPLPLYELYIRSDLPVWSIHQAWSPPLYELWSIHQVSTPSPCMNYTSGLISPVQSMPQVWFTSPCTKYAPGLISLPLYEVCTRHDPPPPVWSMHQAWSPSLYMK